jgi:hypothetical protein
VAPLLLFQLISDNTVTYCEMMEEPRPHDVGGRLGEDAALLVLSPIRVVIRLSSRIHTVVCTHTQHTFSHTFVCTHTTHFLSHCCLYTHNTLSLTLLSVHIQHTLSLTLLSVHTHNTLSLTLLSVHTHNTLSLTLLSVHIQHTLSLTLLSVHTNNTYLLSHCCLYTHNTHLLSHRTVVGTLLSHTLILYYYYYYYLACIHMVRTYTQVICACLYCKIDPKSLLSQIKHHKYSATSTVPTHKKKAEYLLHEAKHRDTTTLQAIRFILVYMKCTWKMKRIKYTSSRSLFVVEY